MKFKLRKNTLLVLVFLAILILLSPWILRKLAMSALAPPSMSVFALTQEQAEMGMTIENQEVTYLSGNNPPPLEVDIAILQWCAGRAFTSTEMEESPDRIVPPAQCFTTEKELDQHIADEVSKLVGHTIAYENFESNNVLIAESYDYSSYGGAVLKWYTGSTSGCFGGNRYYAPNMPSGWDNKISSSKGFSGCYVQTYWECTYYMCSLIHCDCSYMGAMSDEASSVQFGQWIALSELE